MAWPFNLFRDKPAPAPARRSFDAATGGRRASGFKSYGPHGPETLAAAAPIRSRARHAYANNGYVANAVNAMIAEIVGSGVRANSAHPDADLRPIIDACFSDCAAAMDSEGRTDFYGIQASMVLAMVVDGEAFALIEESEDGIKLRQIPAEMVDESMTRDLGAGGYIVAGVEFDAMGRRVAYWILSGRPTDLFPTYQSPTRVAAADVIHLMRPLGPGQVRGVSWLSNILITLNEFDQLSDALLVASKMAAMLAAFIVDGSAMGGSAFPDAKGDIADLSLEPGTVRILPAGTDIRFSAPEQTKDGVPFARLVLGQIASGLGVPTHLLDNDLTGANYSSLRAGLLPFRAKVEQLQYHVLIPQFLDPVFRRVVTHEYLSGRLDLPALAPALKAEWLTPRAMQVDPLKDIAALEKSLALGLTSRRQAVASLGWSVADLDAEISADREREATLGLTFSTIGVLK